MNTLSKVVVTIMIATLIGVVISFAAGTLYWEKNTLPYWYGTLLSGVTTTGAGASNSMFTPFDNYTCQTVVTGQTPTTTTVNIEGSIDNSTWSTIGTTIVTGLSNSVIQITAKPMLYSRGNFASFTSNTTTKPTVTVKCLASH